MVDYASLANVALEQIADKGRDVTFKTVAQGTYNPATDVIASDSKTSTTVKAVISSFKAREIDGTIIKAGDKKVMLAASGNPVPVINDEVADGGLTYKVVAVEEVKPGDTALIYKLQVRR